MRGQHQRLARDADRAAPRVHRQRADRKFGGFIVRRCRGLDESAYLCHDQSGRRRQHDDVAGAGLEPRQLQRLVRIARQQNHGRTRSSAQFAQRFEQAVTQAIGIEQHHVEAPMLQQRHALSPGVDHAGLEIERSKLALQRASRVGDRLDDQAEIVHGCSQVARARSAAAPLPCSRCRCRNSEERVPRPARSAISSKPRGVRAMSRSATVSRLRVR